MTTHTVNGTTYHLHTNRHTRPLYSYEDLPLEEREIFHYIKGEDRYSYRLFNYLGYWYDYHEFEIGPDDVKALGFDAWQPDSYFSATVVCFFDRDGYELDGEIIVGRIHW